MLPRTPFFSYRARPKIGEADRTNLTVANPMRKSSSIQLLREQNAKTVSDAYSKTPEIVSRVGHVALLFSLLNTWMEAEVREREKMSR